MDDKAKKVLDRLRCLCSRREYCISDVRKKAMTSLDGDAVLTGEIIESLVAEKYIDESRYACAYARDKSTIGGWGTVKIRYMLASKGIPSDIINEALSEVDRDKASGKLYRLLESKVRSLKDDPQSRLKLLRYGLGRGYQYNEVEEVVNSLLKNEF